MDDKTFIAAYVAQESQRINERLKTMLQSETPPSEEERDAVISDMEITLSRLQSALTQIEMLVGQEDVEEKESAQ